MPKPRELKLEPFSLALARRILEAFPDWEPYLGRAVREEEGLVAHVLQIEVPSANRNVRQPLRIVAELDRIVYVYWFPIAPSFTWHFDWVEYHSVRPYMDWRSDPSGFKAIVEWLREFVSEERVAAVWYEGERWSAGGAPRLSELEAMAPSNADGRLVRSWRGTHDEGPTPEVPFPRVIVYGDPDSTLGRFVAECLDDLVDHRFATQHDLPDTDRLILLDPEWNWSLTPRSYFIGSTGQKTREVKPEEQVRSRLFLVRWEGEEWKGPWKEEGRFEVRSLPSDADLLRRHLLAWLQEP